LYANRKKIHIGGKLYLLNLISSMLYYTIGEYLKIIIKSHNFFIIKKLRILNIKSIILKKLEQMNQFLYRNTKKHHNYLII